MYNFRVPDYVKLPSNQPSRRLSPAYGLPGFRRHVVPPPKDASHRQRQVHALLQASPRSPALPLPSPPQRATPGVSVFMPTVAPTVSPDRGAVLGGRPVQVSAGGAGVGILWSHPPFQTVAVHESPSEQEGDAHTSETSRVQEGTYGMEQDDVKEEVVVSLATTIIEPTAIAGTLSTTPPHATTPGNTTPSTHPPNPSLAASSSTVASSAPSASGPLTGSTDTRRAPTDRPTPIASPSAAGQTRLRPRSAQRLITAKFLTRRKMPLTRPVSATRPLSAHVGMYEVYKSLGMNGGGNEAKSSVDHIDVNTREEQPKNITMKGRAEQFFQQTSSIFSQRQRTRLQSARSARETRLTTELQIYKHMQNQNEPSVYMTQSQPSASSLHGEEAVMAMMHAPRQPLSDDHTSKQLALDLRAFLQSKSPAQARPPTWEEGYYELQTTQRKLRGVLKDLVDKLYSMEGGYVKSEAERIRLEDALGTLQNTHSQCQKRHEELFSQVQSLRGKKELSDQRLSEQAQDLKEAKSAYMAEMRQVKGLKQKLKQHKNAARRQKENWTRRLRMQGIKLHAARTTVDQMTDQLRKLQRVRMTQGLLISQVKTDRQNVGSQRDQANRQASALNQRMLLLNESLMTTQQEQDASSREVSRLTDCLRLDRQRHAEVESELRLRIKQLTEQLGQKTQAHKDAAWRLCARKIRSAALDKQLKSLKSRHRNASRDLQSVQVTLSQETDHRKRLHTELEALRVSKLSADAELEETSEALARVKTSLRELEKSHGNMAIRVQQLQATEQRLMGQVARLKTIQNDLQKETGRLREDVEKSEIRVRRVTEEAASTEMKFKTELHQLKMRNKHSNEIIANLRAEASVAAKRYSQLRTEKQELSQKLRTAETTAASKAQQVASAHRQELSKMKDQLRKATRLQEEAEMAQRAAQAALDTQTGDRDKCLLLEQENARLVAALREAEKAANAFKQQAASAQQLAGEMRAELEEARKETTEARTQLDEVVGEMQGAYAELKLLKSEAAAAQQTAKLDARLRLTFASKVRATVKRHVESVDRAGRKAAEALLDDVKRICNSFVSK